MGYELPKADIRRLRALARQQKELAGLPIMAERKKIWTNMNDGISGARPPMAIESWTFDRDFMPTDIYQCESAYGKRLEGNFLRHIRHHEILNDDHVCPDTFDIGWHIQENEFGIEIQTDYAKDGEGVSTGYHFRHPIEDLEEDGFDMISPATWTLDRESSLAEQKFLTEIFGETMPVVLRSHVGGAITQRLMRLMSMETFFLAMHDCPDKLQALLAMLRDNIIRKADWLEKEGLLKTNSGNQCTCGTCYNFTNLLPTHAVEAPLVKTSDTWIGMDSQETVGVSPQLFREMVYPHYEKVAERFGLVYWGCCEPVDPIWEGSISMLPNLKAVSISRWADQNVMAQALDGRKIVFSRKPNPNLLGVSEQLDEEAWRWEIRSTLDALSQVDVPFEFVVRDVYTMHGHLSKATRAVQIAYEEIDRVYGVPAERGNLAGLAAV